MLLTLTTTHHPATDLGYVLRKHPGKTEAFNLTFGRAHVFYPEASEACCTVALMVEVDPVALVRNQRGPSGAGGMLDQYVNDRPYAASSFLNVALADVFGSALSGKCKEKPELGDLPMPLVIRLAALPCRGGEAYLKRLFEPLGYAVTASRLPLDDKFPDWGDSRYFSVELSATLTVAKALSHLYVLIPVLDNDKHYWVGDDEVEKLLRHGSDWLGGHPERESISFRYLKHHRRLTDLAMAQLVDAEDAKADEEAEQNDQQEEAIERTVSLHEQRLDLVTEVLKSCGAARVLDLGCGEGKLLRRLLAVRQFQNITGMDVSHRSLEVAQSRLKFDRMPERQRSRIQLIQGSLTYRDARLSGFDAAAVVEVIEHLEPSRLEAFQRVLFEFARPETVVLTTPNREYNVKWESLPAGQFRHKDHRFEWTRAEFYAWVEGVCERFGYEAEVRPIGPEDDVCGAPTQMAIFSKTSGVQPAAEQASEEDADGTAMNVTLPELSLVVLVGASGSGKSTFAKAHFKPTEILSSDYCRGLISDDENDQSATKEAFELLHHIVRKRLANGRLTVIDATNVQSFSRKPLVALAREFHCLPVAIVLDVPEGIARARNELRPDRNFGPHVVRQQRQQLHRELRGLSREGFRKVFTLKSEEEIAAVVVTREPLWNNLKHEHGPFDFVGDVHGCHDELVDLLTLLGYAPQPDGAWMHPEQRKLVFVGDLVDRGPNSPDVMRLVMASVAAKTALCVPGNHDAKFLRKLMGKDVQLTHGLAETVAQYEIAEAAQPGFKRDTAAFLDSLISHYVLDGGRLVVAHAGMKESMQGRGSGAVREFALYGETTGETDEFGLPVRLKWAEEYRGRALVVYGHTPVPEPEWLNHTVNIDTGCVFGGKLTALRYPEKEILSVPARMTHAEPRRPFLEPGGSDARLSLQQQSDTMLDIADVIGKRVISTRLLSAVTVREENAIAALEVMSRFAVDPKWLIYLPPTMSPCGTSPLEGWLEHPLEAFAYFKDVGIRQVICEEKHMGSRAVVIVCRNEDAARERFGVTDEGIGIVYTRTGRRFFDDGNLEAAFLEQVSTAVTAAGLWEELNTTWLVLDCELMPWSAKARELLRTQYASVGAAARAASMAEWQALEQAAARGVDTGGLLERARDRVQTARDFTAAYQRYCWPVNGLEDLRLAPFHLLASEGAVHADKDHVWHLEMLGRLKGSIIMQTASHLIDLDNEESLAGGVRWWEELTGNGGEGMVVKPLEFIVRGLKGLVQPAVKCRGREYLRIIYGPEYTLPENLTRLKNRKLSVKRALAMREFSLGIESLERFVRKEPLRRVHEAVFGVLALESEPVDPRL